MTALSGLRAVVTGVDVEARRPFGRLVSADEAAAATCYLAGPDAASTTGTVLAVDGAMQGLRPRR
jgi:2-keto-3-deoxy-L-fuconate dehydrogenase